VRKQGSRSRHLRGIRITRERGVRTKAKDLSKNYYDQSANHIGVTRRKVYAMGGEEESQGSPNQGRPLARQSHRLPRRR